MSLIQKLSRRDVLKGAGATAGFVLAAQILPKSFISMARGDSHNAFEPNVFVRVDTDGTVTIVAHRIEMGQGVRTGLPMIVADEMEADWSRVEIEQAPGDESVYGFIDGQNTDGSRSTRHHFTMMREMGAGARQMLIQAAANTWGVGAGECYAKDHRVHHTGSGRSADFGELTQAAGNVPVPATDQLQLKDESDWKYIGKDSPSPLGESQVPEHASQIAELDAGVACLRQDPPQCFLRPTHRTSPRRHVRRRCHPRRGTCMAIWVSSEEPRPLA